MKAQLEAAMAVALSAVAQDPGPGPIEPFKRWRGEVLVEAGSGRRRLVVQRDQERAELVRCPAAAATSDDYPPALPFVPGETLWWGRTAGVLVGTWVRVRDRDAVAAALVAASVGEGWLTEQFLPWSGPFPQLNRMTRRGAIRLIVCQAQHVTLTEYPEPAR